MRKVRKPLKKHIIDGVIRDSGGQPVKGIRVRAFDAARFHRGNVLGEGRSDPEGRFTIRLGRSASSRKARRQFAKGEGPDVAVALFRAKGEFVAFSEVRRGVARFKGFDFRLPGGRGEIARPEVTGRTKVESFVPETDEAWALKQVGVHTVGDLRNMDPDSLAATPALKQAGLDRARLRALRARALLHASTFRSEHVRAIEAAGFGSLADVAFADKGELAKGLKKAIRVGALSKDDSPSPPDAADLIERARELIYLKIDRSFAELGAAGDRTCDECDEDCCAEPAAASLLSRKAYSAYLLGHVSASFARTGRDVGSLRQDFESSDCEDLPIVRLGIEVLERALLAADFGSSGLDSVRRGMLAYRMVTRKALLRQARAASPAFDALVAAFEGKPASGSVVNASRELEEGNRRLRASLEGETDDPAFRDQAPHVGGTLTRAALVAANKEDFEDAKADLDGFAGLGAAVDSLRSAADPDSAGQTYALNHRRRLIEQAGKNASELRRLYHVNVLATDGTLTRCEQAILTLQEALACEEAAFEACCVQDMKAGSVARSALETGLRFKDYPRYRQWVTEKLYPEIFYDLHVKSTLVQGDVAALRTRLGEAEKALEAAAARSEAGIPAGLFQEGFRTIRELLDIDGLMREGHTAFRDEEYGVALARYGEAAGRIRAHVGKYHSATIATYEELFYGLLEPCDGGRTRIGTAAELLERLEKASLRPTFIRQLVSPERVIPLEKRSGFWPSGGLPSFEDLADRWEALQTDPVHRLALIFGGGAVTLAKLFGLYVQESEVRALQDALPGAGWKPVQVPDGVRFSLPFIVKDDPKLVTAPIQKAFNDLLIKLAFPEIQGRVGAIVEAVTEEGEALRDRMVEIWGDGEIGLDVLVRAWQTLEALGEFGADVVALFDLDLILRFVTDCDTASCVVDKIVAVFDNSTSAVGDIKLTSPEEFLESLGEIPGNVADAIKRGIEATFGPGWDPASFFNRARKELVNEFGRTLVREVLANVLVESEGVWLGRGGAIQEVSDVMQHEDIADGKKFRRGALLLDKEGLDRPSAYNEYKATFRLRSDDNDDLGVVFRVSEDSAGRPSYYALTIRGGKGEFAEHDLQKRAMQFAWVGLMAVATYGASVATGGFALPAAALTAVPLAIAGVVAVEYAWGRILPPDRGGFSPGHTGHFVRLSRIAPGEAARVLEEKADFEIKQGQEYDVEVAVSKREGGIEIRITLSEPEGPILLTMGDATDPRNPSRRVVTDPHPLPPGGVGLYSFANRSATFTSAVVEYNPAGTGTLGKLLFAPPTKDGVDVGWDPAPYSCRMTGDPEDLPDWIRVDADDYELVRVKGPSTSTADESENTVDLSPFDVASKELRYGLFDPVVDRVKLAQLLNRLNLLLPHQYFFVLPLCIGDALHGAGEFAGAKRHYDAVYDLFPREVLRKRQQVGESTSETEAYADEAAGTRYSFLHADIPVNIGPFHSGLLQRGVEEALLKSRHAANFLAQGEGDFFADTDESRARAYLALTHVLSSYGAQSCCDHWSGRVFCVPGAHPAPESGGPAKPADPLAGADRACREVVSELKKRLAHALPPVRAALEARIAEIPATARRDPKALCEHLAGILEDKLSGPGRPPAPWDTTTSKLDSILNLLTDKERAAAEKELEKATRANGGDEGALGEARASIAGKWQARVGGARNRLHDPDGGLDVLATRIEALGKEGARVALLSAPGRAAALKFAGGNGASSPFALSGAGPGTGNGVAPFGAGPLVGPVATPSSTLLTGTASVLIKPGASKGSGPAPCGKLTLRCRDEDEVALYNLAQVFDCPTPNPLRRAHLSRACLYLGYLDNALNILGFRKDQPSCYAYDYLLALAKNFTQFAVSAEKDYLAFREKLSEARLTMMQQDHALQLLGAQMRVRDINLAQAENQLEMAKLQEGRAQAVEGHLDAQLALNDAQLTLTLLSGIAGVSQGALSLVGAGIGLVAAIPTGGASLLLSAASFSSAATGVPGAVIGAASGVLAVLEKKLVLEQSRELLRNFDLPLARLGEEGARLMRDSAQAQIAAGLLEIRLAEMTLTYIANRFLNADMYAFLADQTRAHYRQYLLYGTQVAVMAERALELQEGREFQIIKLNYFDVPTQGLMGGEALQRDLESLDFQKFIRDERLQAPPPKLYSLAASFPLEFAELRATGQMVFRTAIEDFDPDFPGHHQRLIRSVRLNAFALTGPEGIKATLSQLGPSQVDVRRRDGSIHREIIPGVLQEFPLSRTGDGFGLTPVNPDRDGKLQPFEGTGVGSWWRLSIPRHANRFDYRTIADIQFSVEYTAYHDSLFAQRLRAQLTAERHGRRAFRFRFDFPDALYHLQSPSESGLAPTTQPSLNLETVVATTRPGDYAFNEQNRRIEALTFAIFGEDGKPLPVDKVYIATRRQIEALWRASGLRSEEDDPASPLVPVGRIRVLRDGEPRRILAADTRPGEVPLPNEPFRRVLRGDRLLWIPASQQRAGDIWPVDAVVTPLPSVVPHELLLLARKAFTQLHVAGSALHIFELLPDPAVIGLEETWFITLPASENPALRTKDASEVLLVMSYAFNLIAG